MICSTLQGLKFYPVSAKSFESSHNCLQSCINPLYSWKLETRPGTYFILRCYINTDIRITLTLRIILMKSMTKFYVLNDENIVSFCFFSNPTLNNVAKSKSISRFDKWYLKFGNIVRLTLLIIKNFSFFWFCISFAFTELAYVYCVWYFPLIYYCKCYLWAWENIYFHRVIVVVLFYH